jgi:MoaA/NifB/PqqE/SkfB family radical SAM enzyme
MNINFRLEHLKFYSLLARVPHFVLSYASDFRILPRPVMMTWEVTYRCPTKCISCARWQSRRTKDELSIQEGKRLVDDAYRLGVRLLVISGGDPLMKKDCIQIGRYARMKGMRTVLCTNGFNITIDNIGNLLESFDVFELPIDSLIPEIHDSFRGVKGSFERTQAAIRLLVMSKKPSHGIEITTVVRDNNYREVAEINQIFTAMSIVTAIQPLHQNIYGAKTSDQYDWAKNIDSEWNSTIDHYQWYDRFSKYALESYFKQIPKFIRQPNHPDHSYKCFAGSYSFNVDPEGNICICDGIRLPVGNVREKPLYKIWEEMRIQRTIISSNRRECNCWLLCTAPPSIFLSKLIKPLDLIKKSRTYQ